MTDPRAAAAPFALEQERVRSAYARRGGKDARYTWASPSHVFRAQEREGIDLLPDAVAKARRLAPYSWLACYLLARLGPLCMHYLGTIRKEA